MYTLNWGGKISECSLWLGIVQCPVGINIALSSPQLLTTPGAYAFLNLANIRNYQFSLFDWSRGLFRIYNKDCNEICNLDRYRTLIRNKRFWHLWRTGIWDDQESRIFFVPQVFPFKQSLWLPRNLHLCRDTANGKVFISKCVHLWGTPLLGLSWLFILGFTYHFVFIGIFNMNNSKVALISFVFNLFMKKIQFLKAAGFRNRIN